MKHVSLFLALIFCFAAASPAATPIVDVRLTGANNNLQSGATFTFNSGSSVNFTGATVSGLSYGTGSVTSVGLAMPSGLTITNSPVTASGTLTASLSFSGIVKSTSGTPGSLAAASSTTDYVAPGAYTAAPLTMATARLLGRTTASTGAAEEITVGSGLSLSSGTLTATGGGTGTVTSVAATVPSFLSLSGSPITTSGTLAITLATQSANLVFAGPSSGTAAAPTFRSLVTADFPTSGATAGSYGDGTHVPAITVDATGRITAVSSTAITGGGGSGTVNSGTATQVAYYSSTGTTVSSSAQFTVGSSGNPSVTAAGTNQDVTLTPSGTGRVVVANGSSDSQLIVNSTSNGPVIRMQKGGATQTLWGVSASTDNVVTGSSAGDTVYRSDVSKAFLFSTDAGTSYNLKLIAANGGVEITNSLTLSTSTGALILPKTITTTGTTGNQTINKASGSVNLAASATSLTVTDSIVTANSIIICTVATNDSACKSVQAVPTSGSFTIYPNSAPAAETRIQFLIVSP